jgi:hypothetical protein
MSAIRNKARNILDAALPAGTIITSNGPTAQKYTEMTGLSHKTLTDNWAAGGIMTGCNGFTGWYGAKLGSKTYLGGFDLQGIVKKAGRPEAWVESMEDNWPNYGDILRHTSFHVDVALDFDGELLLRAAGGQGGPKTGCDIIKRVHGSRPYDPNNLQGWIDIDIFFASDTDPPTDDDKGVAWLLGWWTVWDGNAYYYHFAPNGLVRYTKTTPAMKTAPPSNPLNTGRYRYSDNGVLVLEWNPADGGVTKETFYNAFPNVTKMNATSNRYSPLVATRM